MCNFNPIKGQKVGKEGKKERQMRWVCSCLWREEDAIVGQLSRPYRLRGILCLWLRRDAGWRKGCREGCKSLMGITVQKGMAH